MAGNPHADDRSVTARDVADAGGGDDLLARQVGDAEVVRRVFDGLGLVVVSYVGPELRVAAANTAFRALVNRSEVVGERFRDLWPETEGQQLLAMVQRVARTGVSQVGREWRIQIDPDRTGTMREIFLDFVMIPFHDTDGTLIGTTGYAIDVTDQVLCRRAEQERAVEAERRYQAARDVVAELQAALLPTTLPVLPGAQVGARYLVAASDQAAGGDWFDAMPLAGGRLALVVGDVVGHGVAASAAMGQLRAVLKHLLTSGVDLPTVMARLDGYASGEPAMRAATLAVVVLDPATGELVYSLCGHPLPLVVREDGSTTFLADTATGPLGVGQTPRVAIDRLDPGELVLLYSDGLIERPTRTLAEGAAELATVAADAVANRVLPHGAAPTPVERVCQLTVELLTRTGYSDDVTTLAAQRLADAVPPLSVELTADLPGHRAAMNATRGWLSALQLGDETQYTLELGVGEVVTNAVEHAYRGRRPGAVRLTAELRTDGVCEFRISDQGRWRTPEPADTRRGRGLMLCERLLDELTVTHPPQSAHAPVGARGTTVTLRHRIRRPAMLVPDSSATAGEHDRPSAFHTELVISDHTTTMRAFGPIDISTADDFARDLSAAARGGPHPVVLDLTKVTHLASAGVRALYDAAGQTAAHRQPLTLLTAPGSPAAFVLDLVHLPHTERPAPADDRTPSG